MGDPRTWRVIEPPDDDGWYEGLPFSFCGWNVVKEHGELRAEIVSRTRASVELPFTPSFRPTRGVAGCVGQGVVASLPEIPLTPRQVLEFENGFLVAYNDGEWGGGIYWYARDGVLRATLSEEPVAHLVTTRGGVVALVGIAHLVMDRGRALRLTRTSDSWKVRELPLPGAPQAALLDSDGSLLVVTSEHLVRIGKNSKVELLHAGKWSYDSTSIQKDAGGALYIGMAHAVARLVPTNEGYSERWLVPRVIDE